MGNIDQRCEDGNQKERWIELKDSQRKAIHAKKKKGMTKDKLVKKWIVYNEDGTKSTDTTFDTLNQARFALGAGFRHDGLIWSETDGGQRYLVKEKIEESKATDWEKIKNE